MVTILTHDGIRRGGERGFCEKGWGNRNETRGGLKRVGCDRYGQDVNSCRYDARIVRIAECCPGRPRRRVARV
jgi:hypothetical protein